jgi:hypothetical protein
MGRLAGDERALGRREDATAAAATSAESPKRRAGISRAARFGAPPCEQRAARTAPRMPAKRATINEARVSGRMQMARIRGLMPA